MTYQVIKDRVAEIALKCGRDPKEISIVAVSKGHPWEHAQLAYDQGCRYFAENRIQEALPKISEAPKDIHWHLIGSLQKNKVAKAIENFELIHSVDSLSLAEEISRQSLQKNTTTRILIQVNTSGEPTKHGLSETDLLSSFPQFQALPGISIAGLMTIGPLSDNEKNVRQCFARLRILRDRLGIKELSMGMSQDYPWAIAEGATLLRLGRAIFS